MCVQPTAGGVSKLTDAAGESPMDAGLRLFQRCPTAAPLTGFWKVSGLRPEVVGAGLAVFREGVRGPRGTVVGRRDDEERSRGR